MQPPLPPPPPPPPPPLPPPPSEYPPQPPTSSGITTVAAAQPPPPPPPPPQPPHQPTTEPSPSPNTLDGNRVTKAASTLESIRSLHAEHESALHFACTLLTYPRGLPSSSDPSAIPSVFDGPNPPPPSVTDNGGTNDSETVGFVPGGVKDAWLSLVEHSSVPDDGDHRGTTTTEGLEYPLGTGQLAGACRTKALAVVLHRAAHVASLLRAHSDTPTTEERTQSSSLSDPSPPNNDIIDALTTIADAKLEHMRQSTDAVTPEQASATTPSWFMDAFRNKVQEIRTYHAKNDTTNRPILPPNPSDPLLPTQPTTTNGPQSFSIHPPPIENDDSIPTDPIEHQRFIEQHNQTMRLSNIPNASSHKPNHPNNNNDLFTGGIDAVIAHDHHKRNLQDPEQSGPKLKRKRCGHPLADGYDLSSLLSEELSRIRSGQTFSSEEVMGKYLDLHPFHEMVISSSLRVVFLRSAAVAGGSGSGSGSGESTMEHPRHTARARAMAKITYSDFVRLLLSSTTATHDTILLTNNTHNNTNNTNNNAADDTTETKQSSAAVTALQSIPEQHKLSQRKKYVRLLDSLRAYLSSFLARTHPLLLDVGGDVVRPAMEVFEEEWSRTGGVLGWECKDHERCLAIPLSSSAMGKDETSSINGSTTNPPPTNNNNNHKNTVGIDLKNYTTVDHLLQNVTPDKLKSELARLGMKCGGKPSDRATRLWQTRDTPLEKLPAKLFVKGRRPVSVIPTEPTTEPTTHSTTVLQSTGGGEGTVETTTITGGGGGGNLRRIDIARAETTVLALLDQLRPTLDATARRADRRLTQTRNEKEREVEEEIDGSSTTLPSVGTKRRSTDGGGGGVGTEGDGNGNNDENNNDDDSDDDSEDTKIYNPKGVPLGWDGKPIPYWLFKLHGLNHFYPCEICGNESYRGRRNFEKHFTESKHTYGMRCLGIPNTRHFHGVTKIADAQVLWKKLKLGVEKDIFDGSVEEEYEDSQGNVLSRATYEDLARQGLL